ncbi:MAG: TolB family protein, partial [Rhodanobacteraceae bacterium]
MYRDHKFAFVALLALSALLATTVRAAVAAPAATHSFTLRQVLDYPFPSELTASSHGNRVSWVINLQGVRNVWVAQAPGFAPHQVTHFKSDDGQEITQLTFSPSGNELVFVRGGDHDANWPEKTPADPASSPVEPKVMLWAVDLGTDSSRPLAEGDAPAISADGRLAYIRRGQVWTDSLSHNTKAKPRRLFFDRAPDSDLHWSPNGKRLAFVSNRGDHAFIGIYTNATTPLLYLAPSTHIDGMPRWSPNGKWIAFVRQPGRAGPFGLFSLFTQTPEPWSIVVANSRTGQEHVVWKSSETATGTLLLT